MLNNKKNNEIGGYIELDKYHMSLLHKNSIALNCGRSCLKYLIKSRKINKIVLPYFLCNSVKETCMKEGVDIRYYCIDENFCPSALNADNDEWVYIVNYYGQLSPQKIAIYRDTYKKIIIDNAQAYFDLPVYGVDTLYTCRKFFGVPDGAFLYTDLKLNEKFEQDESYRRMEFILGRYERSASEFYDMYVKNNELFATEPIKKMSKLTENLLCGIDYNAVKKARTYNYSYLHEKLKNINQLKLKEVEGAFAYPLLIDNGVKIRKKLIQEKIYIPILWPNVLDDTKPDSLEYRYAQNILPLPCDQRYCAVEMDVILEAVNRYMI